MNPVWLRALRMALICATCLAAMLSSQARAQGLSAERLDKERWLPLNCVYSVERGTPVLWMIGALDRGSSKRVTPCIAQKSRYREIWLNSPGGSVYDSYVIGSALSDAKATVRVPSMPSVFCVSACTILILGGETRIIERKAQFQVHAPSSVSSFGKDQHFFYTVDANGKDGQTTEKDILAIARSDPAQFRAQINGAQRSTIGGAVLSLRYFQDVLGGTLNEPAYTKLAQLEMPPVYGSGPPWIGERNLERDLNSVLSEGVVAMQEILTQLELHAQRFVLKTMREQESLYGRGSKVSGRLLEAMLQCRIQDVCLLSDYELLNLGYANFESD